VGAQANLDTVPDVIPVGVVIHFFCKEGDFRHKSECVDEIPEGKGCEEFVVGFGPHRSINIFGGNQTSHLRFLGGSGVLLHGRNLRHFEYKG
jgi:hypothetical protein